MRSHVHGRGKVMRVWCDSSQKVSEVEIRQEHIKASLPKLDMQFSEVSAREKRNNLEGKTGFL